MVMTSTGSFPTAGFVFFAILSVIMSLAPFAIVGAIGFFVYKSFRQKASRGVAENITAEDRAFGRTLASDEARAAALATPEIREALGELETVRKTIAEEITKRRRLYVPVGIALGILGAVAVWYGGRGGAGSVLIPMAVVFFFGPIGARMLADRLPAANRYAGDFKKTVLPKLLSRFGDFEYLPSAPPPMLDRLAETGLLPAHEPDQRRSDDTIAGLHHGRSLRIDDLELKGWRRKPKGGKSLETVFRGLLVEIEADTPFAGTTVVLQNLPTVDAGQPRKAGLRRIGLEDPLFDETYIVHGDDEVSARALLTPATMERLLVLVDGQMFLTPGVFAEGDRLFVTFPYLSNVMNFFEPHDLARNDAEAQLAYQLGDLANVFSLVDKILETQTLRFGSRRAQPAK
ncbi:DUF3137 domain-containing protein [Chelatococcus sp.]|nr:DUF3137 domain-containing protein [Chelatococcus sp.]MBX3557771.1 DUF3137 domain-containing protein [Chelatococcus sp.]